ncbi:MAG TPA: hypothetical protein VF531_00915 [Bacillota bacterium]
MDADKLDLVHRFSLTLGPKIDKALIKNCLTALAILSDEETGSELKKLIAKL